MTVMKQTLVAILLLFQNAAIGKEQPKHVFLTVNDAILKGQTFSLPASGVSYHAFQSLPYAEPPIRDLRFKPPVPRGLPQSGNFDATRDLPACPQ